MREKSARTRARILDMLRERGGWQSGEALARAFGMSRAALSKHIGALRAAGHVIDGASRRGYRLVSEAEAFTLEAVRAHLATRIIGRGEWLWFARSASTNRDAQRLALEDAPDGSVVMAAAQDAGRALPGRSWHSPQGGLYVSLVLRPRCSARAAQLLTLLGAVAACECAHGHGAEKARVKWPNEVRSGGRKLSGSLTEVGLVGDRVEWLVVGTGMNVNTPLAQLPLELAATSLFAESGGPVCLARAARLFLERADAWYCALARKGPALLLERWKELSETIGASMRLRTREGDVEAVATDVDEEGCLVLRGPDGRRFRLRGG